MCSRPATNQTPHCEASCDSTTVKVVDEAEGHVGKLPFTFQLGWRRFTAYGTVCDHHPNVVFLRCCPSVFDRLFGLLHLLPTTCSEWLKSQHPEFFLPPNVVMKREKVQWEEEFDNEKMIYEVLAPLQGTVVPILYGEARCLDEKGNGLRALIMSNVNGIQLNEVPHLDIAHLKAMLTQCIRALADLGVSHGDSKLDNFLLVGDRIMAIDFDSAVIDDDVADPEEETALDVSFLCDRYNLIDWDACGR